MWRALTDADQLTGWYVERAEVELRRRQVLHLLGEGMDGWGKIDVWEPPHRLRLVHLPAGGGDPGPNDPPLEEPIIEEYTIEASGGTTVLRMVNSGIPDSADWDSFYDGTDVGWDGFFLALRHYILHHAGEPRSVSDHGPLHRPGRGRMERLTAALAKSGKLSGLTAGDRYDITTSLGDHLYGEVVAIDPPSKLLLSVDPLDHGLIEASTFRHLNTDTPRSPSRCGATRTPPLSRPAGNRGSRKLSPADCAAVLHPGSEDPLSSPRAMAKTIAVVSVCVMLTCTSTTPRFSARCSADPIRRTVGFPPL